MEYEIPTEGYLPFVNAPIPIHWDNHAWLMFSIWFLLIPVALLTIRFAKPRPTTYGIPRGTSKLDRRLLWWTVHFYGLYAAIGLSIGGALLAIVLSGGISGTLHSFFGIGAVLMGGLQIVSSWYRGGHGGRQGANSGPDDRSTWGGDHFDMTPQRVWFEAYHKTAGYFTVLLAFGAVATGLGQLWLPMIAIGMVAIIVITLILAVFLQGRGHNHDTYRSVYGDHAEHPFNKRRYDRMFGKRNRKP